MIEREVIEMYSNRTELIYFSAILRIASHSDDRERCNKKEDELKTPEDRGVFDRAEV
jgi:hypothetical protein